MLIQFKSSESPNPAELNMFPEDKQQPTFMSCFTTSIQNSGVSQELGMLEK